MRNLVSLLAGFLAPLLLAFTLGVSVPTTTPVQKAHAATLHIAQATATGGDLCSATAIGPHALLTASHCEMPDDELLIQEGSIDTQIVGRLRDGSDHTIYLVTATFENYALVNQSDRLEQSEEVFLFGNPGDWHDIYRRGYVAGRYRNEILFDFPVFHGDSGAAVFNASGEIVGVLTGQQRQQTDDESDNIKLAFSFRLSFSDAQLAQAKSFTPKQ